MGSLSLKCVYILIVGFLVKGTCQVLDTSSPVFQFKREIEHKPKYKTFLGEKPLLSCSHNPGERVNIDVLTASDNQPETIVSNSILNEKYEDRYKLEYSSNSTDITASCPEINGSVFSCTNLQNYETSSLEIVCIPFQITLANDNSLSFISDCSVDVEVVVSNISKLAPKKIINDTHCEISWKVECNHRPYSLMYTIRLANESDVETRHFSVTVCSTVRTTDVPRTSSNPQPSTLLTATPSQGNGQESPASWIVPVVFAVVGLVAVVVVAVIVCVVWKCRKGV